MISVYIAAPFSEQQNARRLRDALAEHGIGCTSRWLHEECSLGKEPGEENKKKFSRMDRYDVRRAQAVVLWNPGSFADLGTGGRHVESGMGFMLSEMPVIVVGEKSNIFAWLPEALHVPYGKGVSTSTFEEMVASVSRDVEVSCMDFGPTWDSPEQQAARGES